MSKFIGKDFLLENDISKKLFHDYASKMPIIDYHCHISPEEIYKDIRFKNLTEVWLGGDHYKWRLLRAFGIDEKYITGNADSYDKFLAFAKTLPHAIGNPVYIWAHLELKRFFNCELIINEKNAEEIWNICNEKLQNDEKFSARGFIEGSRVIALTTTDDPVDTLEWHKKLKEDGDFKTKVLPAWRPDRTLKIAKPDFNDYIKKLSEVADTNINNFATLCKALLLRMDYFADCGCRASDHGLEGIYYSPASQEELDTILEKRFDGHTLTEEEVHKYEYNLLVFLGKEYYKRNWVFEIHYGVERDADTNLFNLLGADTGFDFISPKNGATGIPKLLDELSKQNSLPKTILFSLNPNDDAFLAVVAGAFSKEGIKGNVQQGAAWWYNDSRLGMEKQMITFASTTVFGNFVGMLTDSRSFLSYPRHEYFRRILCNLIGGWVESGEYPNDMEMLKEMIENICYNNADRFFQY